MAIRKILIYPDDRLRQVAKPVVNFDADLKTLVDDMFETMYDDDGVGLAAIQIGVTLQVITIDVSASRNTPLVLINPEIISREGICDLGEGCLSVPGVYEYLNRSKKITVRTQTITGEFHEFIAEDLFAVCVQHEMDHLKGKLLFDSLSRLKQQRITDKLKKLKQRLM